MALQSWSIFDRLQEGGIIPPASNSRSAADPDRTNLHNLVARRSSAIAAGAHAPLCCEVAKIAEALPGDRVAVQWDVCQEVLAWEGYYEKVRSTSVPRLLKC